MSDPHWEEYCRQHNERMRQAEEDLQDSLLSVRTNAGADANDVLLFNHIGHCGMHVAADAIANLLAAVDALSARVAVLEYNEKTAAD